MATHSEADDPYEQEMLSHEFDESQNNQDPNGFELHEDGTVTNQIDQITLCRSCWCMTKTRDSKCGKCKADKPDTWGDDTIKEAGEKMKSIYRQDQPGGSEGDNTTVCDDFRPQPKADGHCLKCGYLRERHSASDQDKELDELRKILPPEFLDSAEAKEDDFYPALIAWRDAHTKQTTSKVDRFEVIDETGRAYAKGSIYGSPVSVELSYQDDGKTLKVFVKKQLDKGE